MESAETSGNDRIKKLINQSDINNARHPITTICRDGYCSISLQSPDNCFVIVLIGNEFSSVIFLKKVSSIHKLHWNNNILE